jgi:hypothetical protein
MAVGHACHLPLLLLHHMQGLRRLCHGRRRQRRQGRVLLPALHIHVHIGRAV